MFSSSAPPAWSAASSPNGWRATASSAGKPITALTLHDVIEPAGAGRLHAGQDVARDSRPFRSGRGGEADRRAARRHLPSRRHRLGRGRGGFRQGLSHQSRRHAPAASRRSAQVGDGYEPRLVFTSSIAVFGAPFPEPIGDEFFTTPLTSYGTQKAIGELLLVRLHAAAASSTASASACRPSASGRASRTRRRRASSPTSCASRSPAQEAVLPVPDDVRHWHASPALGRRLPASTPRPWIPAPARAAPQPDHAGPVAATVGEQIEALRRVAGDKVGRPHPPRARSRDRHASSRAGRGASTHAAPASSASRRRTRSTTSSASTSRTSWAVTSPLSPDANKNASLPKLRIGSPPSASR